MSVDPETDVCVTCGSTEAMIAAMLGLVDVGDEVILFQPFYELVGSDAKVGVRAKPAVQIPRMPTGEESSSVTDTEADEMEEHLGGLGYLV